MLKHRGFPGRLPGTDYQFTIRRANKKRVGITKIVRRERYADRKTADRKADEGFIRAIWNCFGEEPFERGNLDAGRLSWLIGREVVWASEPVDPASYEQLLRLDLKRAKAAFPAVFEEPEGAWEADDWDDDWDDEEDDEEEDEAPAKGRRR